MSATRFMRHACLSAIAVSSVATVGCLDRPVAPATPKTTSRVVDKETQSAIDKIDLLFMIDNSASMADKQAVLADAVPDLVGRLVDPICVDTQGVPVLAAGRQVHTSQGCPGGTAPEFDPIKDIHIGIVSSSIGGTGANSCSKADPGYNATMEDMSHLITRGSNAQTYAGKGFLQWDPDKKKNPPGEGSSDALSQTFANLVVGTGQEGCGFEQSLEAVYRFLIDPEPYQSITVPDGRISAFNGTDAVVLQQRADFLRPDSLVAIISVSDENDCSVNPTALGNAAGGQGWYNLQRGTFLPRGTTACNTNPNDRCCVSCAQGAPSGCTQPADDPQCASAAAPTDQAQQSLNLRCFNEKQQFGIDFLYPVERYMCAVNFDPSLCMPNGQALSGVTSKAGKVPNRAGDLVDNPLFADLQGTGKAGRDPKLVFWAMIVGVPWQDIARDPKDLTKGYMNSDEISQADRWSVILGDPQASPPVAPKDPLMVESIDPRTGSNPLTGDPLVAPGGTGWNPINGHEWDISSRTDLQYACVFPFANGGMRDCATTGTSCDCGDGTGTNNPLCAPFPGQLPNGQMAKPQYGAKGYPGIRHLQVLKGLGSQGIPASICPANLTNKAADDYGYRPAIGAIIDRLKVQLKGHCLPRILTPCTNDENGVPNDSCVPGIEPGQVPCAILEVTASPDGSCNCDHAGHTTPPPEYITDEIRNAHGDGSCVCQITQLNGDELATCQNTPDVPNSVGDGWCYVDPGQGAGSETLVASCQPSEKRIIRFVNNSGQTPQNNSVVFYTCQEGVFNPSASN